VCYTFGVRFDWDPKKAQANIRKHEVSFEEAAECFADELGFVVADTNHPDRLILVGESKRQRLLFTVYLEQEDGDLIRIISARKATKQERRRYEDGDF
jgi:uncharacterized DUF497 family protein